METTSLTHPLAVHYNNNQCSYQAVTSKIYHLKQQQATEFLPPATS